MTTVLLATSADLPNGEWAGHLLPEAFARAGARASYAVWSDPRVDWAAADAVVLRSTWDYETRLEEFLAWARSVPHLVHDVDVIAWNTDKGYLLALAEVGVPVVPTVLVESEEDLPSALAAHAQSVVKPVVGAGGRGLVVFDGREGGPDEPVDLGESALGPGPWIVQPLVESVRTEGEHSVFVISGRAVSQAVKTTGGGAEVRVHPAYGGATRGVPLDPVASALAERAVATAERLLGRRLVYARVDLLRLDGALVLGELEVTEPGLYLEQLPANADALAAAVLAGRPGTET